MFDKKKPLLELYTDGACCGNPGPGGWGAFLVFGQNKKIVAGYNVWTTNNRMELQGVISGLRTLKVSCKIKLYTDSQYVSKGISLWLKQWIKNNWCGLGNNKAIKNSDLWKCLYLELSKHDLSCFWIKSHNNIYGNNIADALAVAAKKWALYKYTC